jgi:protein ImuB
VIIAVDIPRFALHIALRVAKRTADTSIALGPQPGDPNVIGLCSPEAERHGLKPGLRVGEALARCPQLELIVPDPGATAVATEQVTTALERIGAGVQVDAAGTWLFESSGLERLHGGIEGVIRQTRAAIPVGLDVRIGVAPTIFSALQAARHAQRRIPLHLPDETAAAFLSPLDAGLLPLTDADRTALGHLGVHTIGQFAALPRASVVERFGLDGLRAWHCAHGSDPAHIQPRVPPQPIEAALHFPESVGALPALQAAARMLIGQIAQAAHSRGATIRSITLRAWIVDGGSWTRTITLRQASTQLDRLLTVALPSLAEVSGPVDTLVVRVDASGAAEGTQLAFSEPGAAQRNRQIHEAIRQISGTHGDDAILRTAAFEPWSRLPERQWALVPYDASISPEHSA